MSLEIPQKWFFFTGGSSHASGKLLAVVKGNGIILKHNARV